MVEPIEARAGTTETSNITEALSGSTKLPLNLLFGAPWLLAEEIAFANNEMLDRAQTETHLFSEFLSKMAEAHSANDIVMMYKVCGQHQMDFIRRDCDRLFTHTQQLISTWSRLGQSTR